MRFAVVLLSLVFIHTARVDAQELQPEFVSDQLHRTRQRVNELSLVYGPMDFRLVEPLATLAGYLTNTGRFDEIHEVLDRAAQIVRIHEGLYTPGQFTFLLAKIGNFADSGDWYHARELMQHVAWLLGREANRVDTHLIASLMTLTGLHLRGVAEDAPVFQSDHFRAAMAPNQLAVALGQKVWGRFDMRLIPMLYQLAQQYYFQAKLVDVGGTSGLKLRTYTGTGAARSRRDLRQNAYNFGLRYLREIQCIVQGQTQPSLESIALSEMYLADWQVLFSHPAAARAGYQQSSNILLQAGITREAINAFFAYPVILPAPKFITSWNQAQAVSSSAFIEVVDDEHSSQVILKYSELSPGITFLPMHFASVDDNWQHAESKKTVMFSFSLNGLEQMSLWNYSRRKTAISAAQNIDMISQNYPLVIAQDELLENVLSMRFRPKLIDGVPQPVNARLRYQRAMSR